MIVTKTERFVYRFTEPGGELFLLVLTFFFSYDII